MEIPTWLTSANSPFRDETRQHMMRKAQEDPRLLELIARIQAKSPGEGSKERQWARKVCSSNLSDMHMLPQIFTDAQDLDDVLRLAAYRSDHSYSDFFIQYAYGLRHGTLSAAERRQYSEAIRMITPIVMDLQPTVAIGFAPQILSAHRQFDIHPYVEEAFEHLAEKHPRRVLVQPDRFSDFSNRSAIMQAAEEARAATTPRTMLEEAHERNIEGRAAVAQHFSPMAKR